MDLVGALNRIFPDEEALSQTFQEMKSYANECCSLISHNLSHRPDVSAEISRSVNAPQELNLLINEARKVHKLGAETLEKVKNVTEEIRRLDNVKENLMSTMRMLRQLKMLTKLYMQLDLLLKERRYEDMADSVQAASDLIDYFRPFRPLPQISQLSHEIEEMEIKIYAQIEGDFQLAVQADVNPNHSTEISSSVLPAEALKAACHVLDSLDLAHGKPLSKQKLLDWYSMTMLSEYSAIFSPQDEAGSLENVKRRYTYLKNKVLLRFMGFHTNFFPPEWPARMELLEAASNQTSKDLLSQVRDLKSNNAEHIQLLLSSIHETLEFEKFAQSPPTISSKLVPYLSLWVEFQDRQLHQRITSYSRMLVTPDVTDEVIASSKELVNVYRALLIQLSKLKHTPNTVESLAEVLANRLGQYATQVLNAYLPAALKTPTDAFIAGKVDATAEYVITTTLQLEKNIAQQLKDSENISEIFESLALGKFRKVSIRVEESLGGYIQCVIDPLWPQYAAHYNAQHDKALDVSRVSLFTATLISHIEKVLTEIFRSVSTPLMIYGIATRTISVVCVGFLTMAMARVVKPLSESQVEQLLLDLGAIKSQSLLRMTEMIPEDIKDKKGAARLERINPRVLDVVGQAEAVLKVLMTPSEPMETFVRNYQLLIKDRSTLNFRKIIEVKGVRFHPRAIEMFKLMASQEPHLNNENPLLRQISTVPPLAMSPNQGNSGMHSASGNNSGFGINNFRKIGDFLRRDYQFT